MGHKGLFVGGIPPAELIFEDINVVFGDMLPAGVVVKDVIGDIPEELFEFLVISGYVISCHDTLLIKIDVSQADMNTSRIFGDTHRAVGDTTQVVRNTTRAVRDMSRAVRDSPRAFGDMFRVIGNMNPITWVVARTVWRSIIVFSILRRQIIFYTFQDRHRLQRPC